MSLADVTSSRSSPTPDACPECDTSASVTSDLHKYQVACTCKPSSVQYACANEPGPPPPAKPDTPPALPPRPPASVLATNRRNNAETCNNAGTCRRRKYAWWCVGCGALAAALGGLLAAQHILLRAYTASPHHLETVPAAVPAAMLVLTGVCIMSLARRRNRYSYMIKVVGACCLVCALTCVLVTITTTVIHMNKLQTLKFCEYTKLTRTCTCFSMPPDALHSTSNDEGVRCVFEGVSECGVVHGALYWCLRGVFALSVSAVLVCIFSTMLAYQLLSHERKKMYWEQLELRCRSLYRPPTGQASQTAGRPVQSNCNCCSQCHPTQPAWDISLQHRFWAPGRIGNLYSPNPGTGRKTSAWSWFPWPRSNSQNSRCHMGGVPQSGDSAYGFCENDTPTANQTYEDRPYPSNFIQTMSRQPNNNFGQNGTTYNQTQQLNNFSSIQQNSYQSNLSTLMPQGQFSQNSGCFQGQGFQSGFSQEGFGETSGSFDAQTGVWGPPPPYSPQGRSGSRHHLHHPDPASATLLHHHHLDHRNSMPIHDHTIQLHDHTMPTHPHACTRNSFMLQNVPHSDIRLNPELARLNPELARLNQELTRLNPELARLNPELARLNPELACLNQDLARLNPDLSHLAQIYNPEDLARLQADMNHSAEGRFNTLRGHLVPYRNCPRSLGMSAGNLHRDCRLEDNMQIECLHQKNVGKLAEKNTEACPKGGKENLAFQNDKNSPVRSSMQDCHRGVNQNTESEVYFADVSSCCNVSLKAECCLKPSVSALVGTIENHPESTSESDTGSFTLTRQQRPQPQTSSKRRPRQDRNIKTQEKLRHDDKIRQELNNSLRLTEQQLDQLNNSLRMERLERMNETRVSERLDRIDSRDRLNESRLERLNDSRMSERDRERLESRLNESRISDSRMNESRISDSRLNDSRLNESRLNDSRLNESRLNDSRLNESRLNDSRLNESRLNDSRLNDSRLNDSRLSERNNETRLSERINESRINEILESRIEEARSESPKISPIRMGKKEPKSNENSDFFMGKISPISPKTEETLVSDEERERFEPKLSKCLAPDSQYEPVRDSPLKEELKTVHHHCYSDTNTMDSGWQSGSEKQVTD